MAQYTIQLRRYIDAQSQYDPNVKTIDQKITAALPRLFDFDFPIFDESYRTTLETNIVKAYYMHEIGFETMALFKFYLNQWLNLNMPYYNQLYESQRIKFDPLENVSYADVRNKKAIGSKDTTSNAKSDTTRDYNSNVTGNSKTTTDETTQGNSRTIGDDTPQGRLTNTTQYNSDVNTTNSNGETNTTDNQDTTSNQKDTTTSNFNQDTTNNQKSTNDEDTNYTRKGKMSSLTYSEMIEKYRKIIINVDAQIVKDISVLFFGLQSW